MKVQHEAKWVWSLTAWGANDCNTPVLRARAWLWEGIWQPPPLLDYVQRGEKNVKTESRTRPEHGNFQLWPVLQGLENKNCFLRNVDDVDIYVLLWNTKEKFNSMPELLPQNKKLLRTRSKISGENTSIIKIQILTVIHITCALQYIYVGKRLTCSYYSLKIMTAMDAIHLYL